MDIKNHTTPDKLERYCFLWSEARLVIAAVALFLGGVPPVLLLNPFYALYSPISSLLVLSWMISGAVSGYLLYRWNQGGQKLFGKKEQRDTMAFFVNIITGFNLGLAGFLGTNIGMSLTYNKSIYILAGVVYILTAGYLWKRWKEAGEKIF